VKAARSGRAIAFSRNKEIGGLSEIATTTASAIELKLDMGKFLTTVRAA